MSSGPGTGLALGLDICPHLWVQQPRAGWDWLCPGRAWPAQEEAHLMPFPCASMLLCPLEWPGLVSAVSTFTGCHIEISCLIEITSPWCVAWPQGARGVTGAWRAWCRGVLDIGKPPKGGDIVRHGTRKEAIVCWA